MSTGEAVVTHHHPWHPILAVVQEAPPRGTYGDTTLLPLPPALAEKGMTGSNNLLAIPQILTSNLYFINTKE
jgi:hypothetical protein